MPDPKVAPAVEALGRPMCAACEEQPGTIHLCAECYTEFCRAFVSGQLGEALGREAPEGQLDADELCAGVLSLSDARALIRHLADRINRAALLVQQEEK